MCHSCCKLTLTYFLQWKQSFSNGKLHEQAQNSLTPKENNQEALPEMENIIIRLDLNTKIRKDPQDKAVELNLVS